MKKRIGKKLRSRCGASITFALLLFLVCAVLSSVIITAATAVSGRMSQAAELDQKYYSVYSAAELLKDTISGKPVSIVVEETTVETTEVIDGEPQTHPEGTPAVTGRFLVSKAANEIHSKTDYQLVGGGINSDDVPVSGFESIQIDAAYHLNKAESISDRVLTMGSTSKDTLAVTITESLDKDDGTLELAVKNSTAGKKYTLTLVFGLDKSINTSSWSSAVTGSSTVDAGGKVHYTITTTTVKATITTLTWNLTEIKTYG